MKKVMIIMAVVAMTATTHAATFMWQVATGADYAGMSVYCIGGTTAEKVIQAFSATDSATKWAAAVTGLSPVTSTSAGARSMATGDIENVSDGDNLVFAIIDGSIAENNKWYVMADYTIQSGKTFTPPATGTAQKITVGTPTSGIFTLAAPGPDPVPEPTSGLLFVLGMAGLALRRKMK